MIPVMTPHGPRIRVEPGDSPWTIARAYVGAPLRWNELVHANPDKKTAPSGNFVSLVPGEELYVPASWLEYRKEHPFEVPPLPTKPEGPPAAGIGDAGEIVPDETVTPKSFAEALLKRLGAPVTTNNLTALVAWMKQEGGHWFNSARYNPLNTTRQHGSSQAWSGKIPIQIFTSWPEGLEATALTLEQSNMRPIVDALAANSDPGVTMQAVTSTPWCPGCPYKTDRSSINAEVSSYQNRPDPLGERNDVFLGFGSGGGIGVGTLAFLGMLLGGGLWYARKRKVF